MASLTRIGHGFDLHRLEPGCDLIVGGCTLKAELLDTGGQPDRFLIADAVRVEINPREAVRVNGERRDGIEGPGGTVFGDEPPGPHGGARKERGRAGAETAAAQTPAQRT